MRGWSTGAAASNDGRSTFVSVLLSTSLSTVVGVSVVDSVLLTRSSGSGTAVDFLASARCFAALIFLGLRNI